MTAVGTPPEPDEPQARPDWLERIAYFMRPREAGRIVLVHSGSNAKLRTLVLSLLRTAPDLRVLSRAAPIWQAPERSAILLVPSVSDAAWLNQMRPIFEQRALRVVLWCDRDTVGRLLVAAPDFMHWVSHAVVGPQGVPAFAVEGIRCALRARAQGLAWFGPGLQETFAEALPGRRMRRVSAVGTSLERAADVRAAGPSWVVWTEVDAEERVTLAERALEAAGRRTRAILLDPVVVPHGFWTLHGRTMPFVEACRALELAGAEHPGRLAALVDLEPEAVALVAELLRSRVPEVSIEPKALRAEDPGAEVAWMALDRGVVRRGDVLNGKRADAPLLRALGRERASAMRDVSARGAAARGVVAVPGVEPTAARAEKALLRTLQRKGTMQTASASPQGPRTGNLLQREAGAPALVTAITMDLEAQKITTVSAVAETSRRAVEMLLREAAALHAEGQFGEMLRAAERALEGAKYLHDLELEVHATRLEGDALKLLGRSVDALVKYSWILGIADDPAYRSVVETEGMAFDVVSAFATWIESALEVPPFPVDRLFDVLDAGERFIRSIGRPAWRAIFLLLRARLLDQIGRSSEAIGVAEEGLALSLRAGHAPGGGPATHRWQLGHLLRKSGRLEEARTLYQAVTDDPDSHPGDRLAALRGLHGCALSTGDLTAARRFAEEAVRVAEPMGDSASFRALGSLTDACFAQGDLVGARSAADRALSAARRGSDIQGLFFALHRSANVALAEGNLERARADILEAQPHAEAMDRARGRTLHGDALSELRSRLAEGRTQRS